MIEETLKVRRGAQGGGTVVRGLGLDNRNSWFALSQMHC